jgi:hypothetical protein
MTGVVTPVRVEIGTLRVTAASAVEARRLADALPAALTRALDAWPSPPSPTTTRRGGDVAARRADRVAAEIMSNALARLGAGGPVR